MKKEAIKPMQPNTSGKWDDYISKLDLLPDFQYEWEREFYSLIKEFIKENDKIVEFGCSNARWVKFIMNQNKQIEGHGVDINDSGFTYKDIRYYKSDVRKTELQNKYFDVVFSIGLVEHFNDFDLEQIIAEHVRVLKDEGYVIISIPVLNYLTLNFLKIKMLELSKIYTGPKHFHVTRVKIVDMLTKLGYEIISDKNMGWIFRWRGLYVPKFTNNIFFADSLTVVAQKKRK